MIPLRLVTLKKRSDFQRVAGEGQKRVTRFFVMQAAPYAFNQKDPDSLPFDFFPLRFGFIITRKMGNAVKRNRIRRRFKAALQDLLKNIPDRKEEFLDVVLIARKVPHEAPFPILKESLQGALKQMGFID